eukprot:UN01139
MDFKLKSGLFHLLRHEFSQTKGSVTTKKWDNIKTEIINDTFGIICYLDQFPEFHCCVPDSVLRNLSQKIVCIDLYASIAGDVDKFILPKRLMYYLFINCHHNTLLQNTGFAVCDRALINFMHLKPLYLSLHQLFNPMYMQIKHMLKVLLIMKLWKVYLMMMKQHKLNKFNINLLNKFNINLLNKFNINLFNNFNIIQRLNINIPILWYHTTNNNNTFYKFKTLFTFFKINKTIMFSLFAVSDR